MRKVSILFILGLAFLACSVNVQPQSSVEIFSDDGTGDWTDHWFLDGQTATVTNGSDGLTFWAGPRADDDSNHAVLWTKQSFTGDIKIEYDYTRLDSATTFANILYIHATGSDLAEFDKDIRLWAHLRVSPAMSLYYNHMNAIHISYASFGKQGDVPYIRARRYLPETGDGLRGTRISPDFDPAGLFATGIKHHITVEKVGTNIQMTIENSDRKTVAIWDASTHPEVVEGRIGLRHMATRGARYYNFTVSRIQSQTFRSSFTREEPSESNK